MLSALFCVASLLASVTADGYVCPGDMLINPPKDLSEPYFFPKNWNDSMEPAKYAGPQNCNWQINVIDGMYATVTFYKITDSESGITAVYPNNQTVYIADKDYSPYIFTYPQFQVNLWVSEKQGQFSFKVVWSRYPETCNRPVLLDDKQAQPSEPNPCVTTYTAINNVMLVGFSLKDGLDTSLRQSAIYEGDSTSGPYLGNLYDAQYHQIVSQTKNLTIYTFGLAEQFNYTLYMGLDTKAAGDVQIFQGLNCPDDETKPCIMNMNSYYNVTAFATVSRQPDFLKQMDKFPDGSILKIYENRISDDDLLAAISSANYMNQLPIEVKNPLKIYHLDKGRISIPITQNAVDAQWSTVFDGRYVNIHSFYYKETSNSQDTFERFATASNQKLYFEFNVKNFDVNGTTTLDITLYQDNTVVYSESYNASNMPSPNTVKVFGDGMEVKYQTYGSNTKGFEVDLLTTKNDDVSPFPNTSTHSASTFQSSTSSPTSRPQSSSISPASKSQSESISTIFMTSTDVHITGSTNSPKVQTTSYSVETRSATTSAGIGDGTTQGYQSTTKSGNYTFSAISWLIVGTFLILRATFNT